MTLLNQFEPPKKKKEDTVNDGEWDLIELADGLEQEDLDVCPEEAEAAAGQVEKDDVMGLFMRWHCSALRSDRSGLLRLGLFRWL